MQSKGAYNKLPTNLNQVSLITAFIFSCYKRWCVEKCTPLSNNPLANILTR